MVGRCWGDVVLGRCGVMLCWAEKASLSLRPLARSLLSLASLGRSRIRQLWSNMAALVTVQATLDLEDFGFKPLLLCDLAATFQPFELQPSISILDPRSSTFGLRPSAFDLRPSTRFRSHRNFGRNETGITISGLSGIQIVRRYNSRALVYDKLAQYEMAIADFNQVQLCSLL